jgi:hypothetical protein
MERVACTHDGHVVFEPKGEFCPQHGTPLLDACPKCSADWEFMGYMTNDVGADFCVHCSHPGPWVSRKKRIAWIKGRLHQHGLDQATELELRDALDRLTNMEPGDTRTIAAWQKLKEVAPRLWDIAKPVITTVTTEEVKRMLGL